MDSPEQPVEQYPLPERYSRAQKENTRGYRVPKRFGMGAIMGGVTLFSLLVALLSAIGVPAIFIASAAGFFITVAFAQMFMFGGRRPRKASIIVGAITAFTIAEIYLLLMPRPFFVWGLSTYIGIVTWGVNAGALGAFIGYLTGGLLAGIFLVLDYFESWLTGKPRSMPGDVKGHGETDNHEVLRARRSDEHGYRVSRRFGLATVAIGMMLIALIMGFFASSGALWRLIAYFIAFFVAVTLAQVFLFGGKKPRRAAVIAGVVMWMAPGAWSLFMALMNGGFPAFVQYAFSIITRMLVFPGIAGAILGYLAGGVLAGVFVALDSIESRVTGKPRRMPAYAKSSVEGGGAESLAWLAEPLPAPRTEEAPGYRVPRRFGMAPIAIGMTLFSILVAGLVRYGVRGDQIAFTIVYFVGVAFAQAFLYGGSRPRKASVVGGGVAGAVLFLAYAFYSLTTDRPYWDGNYPLFARIIEALLTGGAVGAPFGYLAGGILAGIFLVLDYIESWLTGKPRQMPGEEPAPLEASESA